jgi:hypothetical protein
MGGRESSFEGRAFKNAELCIYLRMSKVKKAADKLNDVVQDEGFFAANCTIAY